MELVGQSQASTSGYCPTKRATTDRSIFPIHSLQPNHTCARAHKPWKSLTKSRVPACVAVPRLFLIDNITTKLQNQTLKCLTSLPTRRELKVCKIYTLATHFIHECQQMALRSNRNIHVTFRPRIKNTIVNQIYFLMGVLKTENCPCFQSHCLTFNEFSSKTSCLIQIFITERFISLYFMMTELISPKNET